MVYDCGAYLSVPIVAANFHTASKSPLPATMEFRAIRHRTGHVSLASADRIGPRLTSCSDADACCQRRSTFHSFRSLRVQISHEIFPPIGFRIGRANGDTLRPFPSRYRASDGLCTPDRHTESGTRNQKVFFPARSWASSQTPAIAGSGYLAAGASNLPDRRP